MSTILGASLLLAPIAYAQTSSVTATCKDGTDFSGTTRSGACKGHGGVASWGTAAATTPTSPNKAAPAPTATTGGKTGGPGQVWVNTATKVYHCPGDRYYGKTKTGEFMSQSAAQAAGDRPSGGKACSS
ncbi:MAG: hypothetical protein P4L90_29160 [Rhodopila sp.]|nr:hypothetical protein [Rhodopila sp.]